LFLVFACGFLNSVFIFFLRFLILAFKVLVLFFVLHVDVCYLFLLFFFGFDWNLMVLIVCGVVHGMCVMFGCSCFFMLMFVMCSCSWFLNLVLVLE
jgi:hypothetical protein